MAFLIYLIFDRTFGPKFPGKMCILVRIEIPGPSGDATTYSFVTNRGSKSTPVRRMSLRDKSRVYEKPLKTKASLMVGAAFCKLKSRRI
jgi:hypothetical protein